MKFLGLRLCAHDSNICFTNYEHVKYSKLERNIQIKHVGYHDLSSWTKILKSWQINPEEVDAIGIILDCSIYPYIKCDESKLYESIEIPLFNLYGFKCPIFRIDHHYAHYLSCWTLGEHSDCGFVFDGFGNDFISHSRFKNNQMIHKDTINDYESLGRIMGTVASLTKISGSSLDGAGKVMALKGYGKKNHENLYDNYDSLESISTLWKKNFPFDKTIDNDFQEICDYVRFCHEETEKTYTNYFKNNTSKNDVIFYSGGVAQNTIINSKIKKERKNLLIPPHCNDDGLSLGAVEFLRQYFNSVPFNTSGYPYWQSDESPKSTPSVKTIKKTAEFLCEGKVVGWYQGNGEIGARALGNRSILMNPNVKDGKKILNDKVKNREWFRPFGASILEEDVEKYFDWKGKSEYMLYICDILDKNSFPAITHIDGTCRIQTVSSELTYYYSLINEFKNLSGIPMLLNTSLNLRGKPIAGSIHNALEILTNSEMDVLVVGDTIYEKRM